MTLFAQDNPAQTVKKISVTKNEASHPLNETNGSQNSAKITARSRVQIPAARPQGPW
jgi:hypothetical protein